MRTFRATAKAQLLRGRSPERTRPLAFALGCSRGKPRAKTDNRREAVAAQEASLFCLLPRENGYGGKDKVCFVPAPSALRRSDITCFRKPRRACRYQGRTQRKTLKHACVV